MNMPVLGFGTFRLQDELAYQSTLSALKLGYRHIDTAQIYGNEEQVGQAIADSQINHNEIFVTTKVWNDNLTQLKLLDSVKQSLSKLQLDAVDLLLVHWPAAPAGVEMEEYLNAMLEAKKAGLTREIGLSNFTVSQIKQAAETISMDDIFTNQVEVHPYLQNNTLGEFCNNAGLHITAYMPFAYGKVLKDEVIQSIAHSHQATPAQVVLAWLRQKNMTTIPSSTKEQNMQANLQSLWLTLNEEEIQAIAKLDCGDRQATPDFSPQWDE
ncbi:MAG: 2,5-didehydrogluconate reductase DkgB [Aliiglaciecola sp.]